MCDKMSVIVVNKIQRMLFEIIISKIRCTKSQQKKKIHQLQIAISNSLRASHAQYAQQHKLYL